MQWDRLDELADDKATVLGVLTALDIDADGPYAYSTPVTDDDGLPVTHAIELKDEGQELLDNRCRGMTFSNGWLGLAGMDQSVEHHRRFADSAFGIQNLRDRLHESLKEKVSDQWDKIGHALRSEKEKIHKKLDLLLANGSAPGDLSEERIGEMKQV